MKTESITNKDNKKIKKSKKSKNYLLFKDHACHDKINDCLNLIQDLGIRDKVRSVFFELTLSHFVRTDKDKIYNVDGLANYNLISGGYKEYWKDKNNNLWCESSLGYDSDNYKQKLGKVIKEGDTLESVLTDGELVKINYEKLDFDVITPEK